MAAVALALLTLALLLFVAFPLVREPGAGDALPALSEDQRERLALRERRDAAYAALRELELEHRTGKLTDDDYAVARHELRAEAIEALRRLEELEAAPAASDPAPAPPERAARS